MRPAAAPHAPAAPARQRWLVFPLLLLLPILGMGSRAGVVPLPFFVVTYAGDTLWTAMVYACLVFLWPRLTIPQAAALAVGISFAVELSQLYRAPWLDAVRAHRLGALVLGRGFLASDLVCYTVGGLLAAGVDGLLSRRRALE